jgi:hypothetical protein
MINVKNMKDIEDMNVVEELILSTKLIIQLMFAMFFGSLCIIAFFICLAILAIICHNAVAYVILFVISLCLFFLTLIVGTGTDKILSRSMK